LLGGKKVSELTEEEQMFDLINSGNEEKTLEYI